MDGDNKILPTFFLNVL